MRKWKNHFVNPNNNEDPFYDMFEDWALIESSFAQQYGIRLRREEMSWDEFCTLLSGLKPDTPLGSIVSIRSETDKDILKHFTKEQHRIRNEWKRKHIKVVTNKEEYNQSMKMFEQMFANLSKVGGQNG